MAFGSYRTTSVLGQGGMGIVYAAVDESTGARVAIKAFGSTAAASDPLELSRFDREGRILCTIDSEHVARVIDMGRRREDGAPFLVMELLEGETVKATLLRYGKLAPALAMAIGAQTCRGLVRAHAKGIIHRDIKPANLFLAKGAGPSGGHVVKILDFGIAKFMGTAAQIGDGTLTQTGTLVGSPLYMSPEQAMGLKAIDARTDVWSLGMLLFEAIAGRLPFGYIETIGQLIVTVCGVQAPPLREVAPWVPVEIAQIVDRAIRIRPAERFADARAMLDALLATGVDMNITDASIARSAEFGETTRMAPPSGSLPIDGTASHGLAATMRHPGRERGIVAGVIAATVIAVATGALVWGRARHLAASTAGSSSAEPTAPPPSLTASAPVPDDTAAPAPSQDTQSPGPLPPQAQAQAAPPPTPVPTNPTPGGKKRPIPRPRPTATTNLPPPPTGGRETM